MNETRHLSYDVLNSLKDIMEDDFVLLIDTFIQDSQSRLQALQELVGGNDSDSLHLDSIRLDSIRLDSIRRDAHSFKGSCSNLGALRLASFCAVLESKALNKDAADLGVDLADIKEEFFIVRKMMLDFIA